jgi:hypothetical protein
MIAFSWPAFLLGAWVGCLVGFMLLALLAAGKDRGPSWFPWPRPSSDGQGKQRLARRSVPPRDDEEGRG